MKHYLFILLAATLAVSQPICLSAQTVQTVVFPDSQPAEQRVDIIVPAGQLFKVLTWSGSGWLKVDGAHVSPVLDYPSFVIAGPRTLSLQSPPNVGALLCSYILTSNAEVAGPTVPSSSVVIPADATGPVQVALESSTDLVTWTEATPGSYGSSTSKRFFRVRIVTQ